MSYPADPLEPELLALERELSGLRPIQPDFPLSQRITRAMDRMDPVLAILDGIGPIPRQTEAASRFTRWKKPVATAARRAGPLAAAAGFGLLGTAVYHKTFSPAPTGGGTALGDNEPVKRGTVSYDPYRRDFGLPMGASSNRVVVDGRSDWQILERAVPAHPPTGFLGVTIADLDPSVQERLPEKCGVVVLAVAAFSPASESNLGVGDVIMRVNGEPVRKAQDLMRACQQTQPGTTVTLRVSSSGRVFDISPKLAGAPPSA